MTFQFQCPEGHLLEGDESQAHEQIHCPQCGLLFVVPAPPASGSATPKILHIPCPNGHQLDAPIDMLEQDVLCPHCEVQFRLHERDSIEFKQRQEMAHEHAAFVEEFEVGNLWLKWAIAAAVIVVASVLLLFALSS